MTTTTAAEATRPKPDPDDAIRRLAAKHLAANVKMGAGLVSHCSQMVHDAGNGDHLGPLGAAARLINSNARMAHALGMIALVERRSRTIVQHIQPPKSELNSRFEEIERHRRARAEFQKLEDRLNRQLDEERRQKLERPIDPQEEAHALLEEGIFE